MMERIEMYCDAAGEWRWRRIAVNGNVVSESGEGYVNRTDCLDMAERLNPGLDIETLSPEPDKPAFPTYLEGGA